MISLPSITEATHQLYKTAQRFPLPTLCAVILTFLGIYLMHIDYPLKPEPWIWQGLLTAMLGLVSLSALTLVAETTTKLNRGLLMLGGTALLGLYFGSLPADEPGEGSVWMMRHIFFLLGSFIALSWVPFWRQKIKNTTLWLWVSDLIGSLVVTLFFALVLFLGLAAALWSIETLFDLNIDEAFYFDIWIIIAGLFSPLFWLSQFMPAPEKLKEPTEVSGFMGIFTKYIMTPLALGYLVILYSYTAKILFTWEWPKNVLSWLVIAFLGVAIFTYFLWTPLLKPAFEKYRRLFWVILLPQIFMLFMAIGWRINAYSWTENRYFVVILGLWLLGITLYFLGHKRPQFKWVFITLTAVILLSQVGPLSGYSIGKSAQTKRLITYLEEATLTQDNRLPAANIDVNKNREDEIASILDYLNNRHGSHTLKALFPSLDFSQETPYNFPRLVMESYGLEYRAEWERHQNRNLNKDYNHFNLDLKTPFNISGYDYKLNLDIYASPAKINALQGYRFKLKTDKTVAAVEIYLDDTLIESISLKEKFNKLIATQALEESNSIPAEEGFVEYESERLKAKLYLLRGWRSAPGEYEVNVEMYVTIK